MFGAVSVVSRGYSRCISPFLLWRVVQLSRVSLGLPRRADEFPWSQDWHAAISLPLLCPGVKPFFPGSLHHLGCSEKLMERNPFLGADSGAGEISAKSSELLC